MYFIWVYIPLPLCIYPLGRPDILLSGVSTAVYPLQCGAWPGLTSSLPVPFTIEIPIILRSPVSVESISRLRTADPSPGPIDFVATYLLPSSVLFHLFAYCFAHGLVLEQIVALLRSHLAHVRDGLAPSPAPEHPNRRGRSRGGALVFGASQRESGAEETRAICYMISIYYRPHFASRCDRRERRPSTQKQSSIGRAKETQVTETGTVHLWNA
jgi:hypothetical protein